MLTALVPGSQDSRPTRRSGFLLGGIAVLITCGLLAYSQTDAFGWDEGYHLLAAQLIRAGRRPYLDFCFPQTPIAAYWNAAWMSLFGESWRTVHALAALCSSGAAALAAGFVFRRFPVPGWRLAGAIAAVFLIAANTAVVQFATAGQPYGLCLFLIVGAFLCAVFSVNRTNPLLAASAGFLAGAAAASSLLTAPAAPVLLVWIVLSNRGGSRRSKFAWFAAATVISWAPIFWLFLHGPRQVFFNVIEYMLLYRRAEWPGASRHDFEVFISVLESPQALTLGVLAAFGLFRAPRSQWRNELYLCLLLATTLALHVSFARPTFPQYYLFTVPFLSILACSGLYEVGSRLGGRPLLSALALAAFVCFCLAKRLYDEARNDFLWRDMEAVARQVEQVTPHQATLLASDEHVYFLTRRPPPSGMEVEDSHGIPVPPADATLLHLVPRAELRKRMEAGTFDTVEICDDDPERVQELGLSRIYARSAVIDSCYVFWERTAGRPGQVAQSSPLH